MTGDTILLQYCTKQTGRLFCVAPLMPLTRAREEKIVFDIASVAGLLPSTKVATSNNVPVLYEVAIF